MPSKTRARVQTSQLSTPGTNGEVIDVVANEYGELIFAGYDWGSGTTSSTESDPLDQRYVVNTFVLTNVPNATPDETIIIDMDGYTRCSVQVEKASGSDSLSAWTMLASVESADSSADFIDATQYGWTSATTATAATYNADGILYTNRDFSPRAHRVKIVTSGGNNDADFNVFVKKYY